MTSDRRQWMWIHKEKQLNGLVMTKPEETTPLRVAVISLGCAKNLVDSEVMCGYLATEGFQLTNVLDAADILLINTCSFIADARAEAEQEIQGALDWKGQRPGRCVVVTGCLPQRDLRQARETFPGVDLFLGLDDVPRVVERIRDMVKGVEDHKQTTFATSQYLYNHDEPRLLLTPGQYAYVKIAEGCNHGCTFCSIPAIRGRRRSRSMASVIEECKMLLAQGALELNLIAQDTTSYGRDLGGGSDIVNLLKQCDATPGEWWLRLLYTHPLHFTEELMDVFARADHLLPYVDIPLQHIASPILRAMGRGMDGDTTRRLMHTLRERIPGVTVRTTFLVGFPGETEEDFQELMEFVSEFEFDRLGVFAFSPEKGTPAAAMREQVVPSEIAEERRDQLLAVQQKISLAKNRRVVGQTVRVLPEAEGDDEWFGRTVADAPDVDNVVRFKPSSASSEGFVDVKITDAGPYELMGKACGRG